MRKRKYFNWRFWKIQNNFVGPRRWKIVVMKERFCKQKIKRSWCWLSFDRLKSKLVFFTKELSDGQDLVMLSTKKYMPSYDVRAQCQWRHKESFRKQLIVLRANKHKTVSWYVNVCISEDIDNFKQLAVIRVYEIDSFINSKSYKLSLRLSTC